MAFARDILSRACNLADTSHIGMKEFCLGYVIRKWPKAKIIFGAETVAQVLDNVQIVNSVLPEKVFRVADELLLRQRPYPVERHIQEYRCQLGWLCGVGRRRVRLAQPDL